jgi:hypothetical protein
MGLLASFARDWNRWTLAERRGAVILGLLLVSSQTLLIAPLAVGLEAGAAAQGATDAVPKGLQNEGETALQVRPSEP